jgi:predicted acylesterase/phospholipase RssA/CRP-like cAMP-binding protein
MQNTIPDVSQDNLLTWMKTNEIFGRFSDDVLRDFLAEGEWVDLHEGETLFRQGDSGGFFCLVYSGALQATVTHKNGSFDILSILGPGKTVGEIQLLIGGTRSADVSAVEDTRLLKFTRKAFDGLAQNSAEIMQTFAGIIRGRLRRSQLVEILPHLYGPLNPDMLKSIEEEVEWIHIPFGQALFHQGDQESDLYLLVSGRLQVCVPDKTGGERKAAEIKRGEIVGEMAMFTGDKRTASIYAMRDSDLVRISREAFERIIASHPNIMMYFIQFIVKRMQAMSAVAQRGEKTLNIAVIPGSIDAPLTEFTRRLVEPLSLHGKTLHLSSEIVDRHWGISGMAQESGTDPNGIRLNAWLDEQESKFTNIVYEADPAHTSWTTRCLQYADRVMIVARAEADPEPGELEQALFASDSDLNRVHRILVLVHPDGSRLPTGTSQWLNHRQVDSHYHVRWDREADIQRLARILTGNAVGLVLGGGGARGLAHIGVIRALNEAGIPIDMIGGTSMGAMVSSLYAMGMDYQAMTEVEKESIARKPFQEFSLPFIAMIRSKRLDNSVKTIYGDTAIEDMWVTYFCVSSNLTTAEMMVHRRGSVGKAMRASAALPGIVTPVIENNCLLVDGGLFNNVPADIMKEICGGVVIMVNVSPEEDLQVPDQYTVTPSDMEVLWSKISPFKDKVVFPRLPDIMMRTILVGSARMKAIASKAADYDFSPNLDRYGLLEFDSIDDIVDAGYRYARERIIELNMKCL